MRRTLQVFEHESLCVAQNGLRETEFDALVVYNQRHKNCYFTVGYKKLLFNSFVGVIQVGNLLIEILPKADKTASGESVRWRNALVDMLRECGYLKLSSFSRADLHLRRASLFDLYMDTFLHEVHTLLHQGLVRKYRKREGNVGALKGRLIFARQLSDNLIHRERFYTAHSCYDHDNIFNAILKVALQVVGRVAVAPQLRMDAKAALESFDDVPVRRITSGIFDRLRYDRNTERYRYAVALARLIILNYQPDVRSGREDVLAILFDMNALFEAYIYRKVKKAASVCSQDRVEVHGQRSAPFWLSNAGASHLRPDILVRWGDGTADRSVVLDTKWKIPSGPRANDADLRQIYAYNLQFGARSGYLLYPSTKERANVSGKYACAASGNSIESSCGMWFLELFEGDRLRADIGDVIMNNMICGTV